MAFQTYYGYFKYQIMPFGLTNALATFQGYINKMLAQKLDVFVIVYLNDNLIYTRKGYIETVWSVLDQRQKYLLYTNLKKSWFHQKKMRFLGYLSFIKSFK